MVPARDIFAPSFLDRHHRQGWLEVFDCRRDAGVKRSAFMAHSLGEARLRHLMGTGSSDKICDIPGFDDLRKLIDRPDAGTIYRAAFDKIEFTPAIRAAIQAAQDVHLPAIGATALHLRGGDIIEENFRFSGNFTKWVLPFPLAQAIAKRAQQTDQDLVIFGQDPALVSHLCEETGALSASDLAAQHGFHPTQTWFFETSLMARCQQILAGATSSFSQFASWIGNLEIENGYEQFTGEQAAQLALSNKTETTPVSDMQKAFAYWAAHDSYPTGISEDNRLMLLERATRHDPENTLYKLAMINLIAGQGNTDIAIHQLRDLVERETRDRQWSPGCLRATLYNLTFPASDSMRPKLFSQFHRLRAAGCHEATLCLALSRRDPEKARPLIEDLLAAQWSRKDFFTYALERRKKH